MVTQPTALPASTETRQRLQEAFTPHQPIFLPEFLRGRVDLIYRLQDVVHTDGLHAVLYGDRGTGKTSLIRVGRHLVNEPDKPQGRRCVIVSCTADDSFASLWRKVGQETLLTQRQLGLARHETLTITGRLDLENSIAGPSDAYLFIQSLANEMVIVFDEFDRLSNSRARAAMADTIKYFSDHASQSTLVFVGVGKSLSDLLHEHQSISRNIAQIPVNPMPVDELAQIIQKGYAHAAMGFEEGLDIEIANLSLGYPHYTHLLGLWSGREAVGKERSTATLKDVDEAIPSVLQNAEGGLQEQYERAVDSTKAKALFKQVLLACALASKDSLGRFAVRAVQEPLKTITGSEYSTGAYQGHLGRFCEAERGPVLERSGRPKSYRWRFLNPQLIPYILLQGIRSGMISSSGLRQQV